MNQKRVEQPRVYFHHLRGVNLALDNQETLRSHLARRTQQVLAYYLLPGLLMSCSAWKQSWDLLSAWLLRPLQETGWLVIYGHECIRCILSSDLSATYCWWLGQEQLLILLDWDAGQMSGSKCISPKSFSRLALSRKAEGSVSLSCS